MCPSLRTSGYTIQDIQYSAGFHKPNEMENKNSLTLVQGKIEKVGLLNIKFLYYMYKINWKVKTELTFFAKNHLDSYPKDIFIKPIFIVYAINILYSLKQMTDFLIPLCGFFA